MTMNRNIMIKLCCVAAALCLVSLLLLPYKPTNAQHIDVFNIPREKAEEKKPQDVPELAEVEVTDTYTYKVVVEKSRLDEGNVFARELDIRELKDDEKSPYHWGQVNYYDRREIAQRLTRTTGSITCSRVRTGVLYFLPDGQKTVEWGRWSMWDCR